MFYVLYRVYANFKVKVVLSVVQFPHLLNGNENGPLFIGI